MNMFIYNNFDIWLCRNMPTAVPISSIQRHACIDMYTTLNMVAKFPTVTGRSRLRSLETMRYIWGFLPSRYPNSWMVYNRKSENNMDDFGVPWCTPLLGKLRILYHSLASRKRLSSWGVLYGFQSSITCKCLRTLWANYIQPQHNPDPETSRIQGWTWP